MKVYLASPHSALLYKNRLAAFLNILVGGTEGMKVFLAGGISGNLKPLWTILTKNAKPPFTDKDIEKAMKIFLAGAYSRAWLFDDRVCGEAVAGYKPYILESFFYMDDVMEKCLPLFGDFLLDSGAFTFMMNTKSNINWDEYIEKYAEFINRRDIKKFFELDIDSVVGYEQVLKYREKLESLTGKKCIPVWHKSRGIKDFKETCDKYDYIAIGGIVSGEINSKQYGAFPSMIAEAHRRGAKIHGLGFTSLDWLPKCHFDSVDSTAWTTGNRFGHIYKFNGKKMTKIDCPENKRLSDPRAVALNNYTDWIKFQKYAEANL